MDLSQFWYYNMVELLCKERINKSDFDRIYDDWRLCMIETMTSKLKSWASAHLSPLKIDFMSLNRLRLNQSVESIFETNIPYTEQARKG